MNTFRHLRHYAEALNNCSACGLCLSSCPAYAWNELTNSPYNSPRSYIAFIRAWIDGKLPDESLNVMLQNCIDCDRCKNACPIGIPVPKIIRAARADLGGFRKSFPAFILRMALGKPRILNNAARAVARLSELAKFAGLKKQSAALRESIRFSRKIPAGSALFFSGCVGLYALPSIVRASAKIFKSFNIPFYMPAFSCCGAFENVSGNDGDAMAFIRKNLKILRESEAGELITICPHCLRQITEVWPGLPWLEDDERETAIFYAKKAKDIAAFLLNKPGPEMPAQNFAKARWHKPCLLTGEEEKAVLHLLLKSGLQMENRITECCGNICAGKRHPLWEICFSRGEAGSGKTLRNRLVRNLWQGNMASRPVPTLTACPGCLARLDKTGAAGARTAAHWLELYADRLHSAE